MACTGCRPEPDVLEVDFDAAEFAAFVEPDFPFITTSIDARALGSRFPSGNAAVRCLALQLGNDTYACFDTDLLRIAAVWKGGFVSMTGMAQISYNEYGRRNNEIPHILGTPLFGVGMYAGWMTDPVEFTDPRPPGPNPEEPGRGPLSEDLGRWNGVYVFENNAILDYTVAGTRILEQPGSVMIGGEPGLSRTIRTEDIARPLSIVLAEVADGGGSEITGDRAAVFHGPGNDTLTAAAVLNRPAGAEFRVTDDRYLTFHIPAGTPASTFRLVVWHGADEGHSQMGTILDEPVETVDFGSGGPERWPFVTRTNQLFLEAVKQVTERHVVHSKPGTEWLAHEAAQ